MSRARGVERSTRGRTTDRADGHAVSRLAGVAAALGACLLSALAMPASVAGGTAGPVGFTDTCSVPILGSETFTGSVAGSAPARVDPGKRLAVTGYQSDVTLPGSITSDLKDIGAPDPLTGTVTEELVSATNATPASINAAATPKPISISYTAGDPASVAPSPAPAGPFTAGQGGTISFTPGALAFTGNFGKTIGQRTISCTPQSPVPAFASTAISSSPTPKVTTTTLPKGSARLYYSTTVEGSGGTPPYAWALSSGSLPPGLSLDPSTGVISGIPTTPGRATFTVTLTDSSAPPRRATSAPLVLGIGPPVAAPHVYLWGINGEPRNVSTVQHSTPERIAVPAGFDFTAVRAGENFSVGLTSSGQVYTWGDNGDGQLGDGSETDSQTPVLVALPPGVAAAAIAVGGYHALAATTTGAVYAWGANYDGQLGDGSTASSASPVEVALPRGTRARALAAGGAFSLALTSNGRVLAWGDGQSGELGDGRRTEATTPVAVRLPSRARVRMIAAGGAHALALAGHAALYAWGENADGQLGNGNTAARALPQAVALPQGARIAAVAAGAADSLALARGGTILYAWGYNAQGELGDGTLSVRLQPVKVDLPPGVRVKAVTAGQYDNLALTTIGQVLAWGDNTDGQLGNGTRSERLHPVIVRFAGGVRASAIGSGPDADASLALALPRHG